MQERNNDQSDIDYTRVQTLGDNAGLILGEAAQFVLVSSLEKAIELTEIYALVPSIKINAME